MAIRWNTEERDAVTKAIIAILQAAGLPITAESVTRQHILRAQITALPEDRWRSQLVARDVQTFGESVGPYVFVSDLEAVKHYHETHGKPVMPEILSLRGRIDVLEEQLEDANAGIEEFRAEAQALRQKLEAKELELLDLMTKPDPKPVADAVEERARYGQAGRMFRPTRKPDAEKPVEQTPQTPADVSDVPILIVTQRPNMGDQRRLDNLTSDVQWLSSGLNPSQAKGFAKGRHVFVHSGAVPRTVMTAMRGVALSFTEVQGRGTQMERAINEKLVVLSVKKAA